MTNCRIPRECVKLAFINGIHWVKHWHNGLHGVCDHLATYHCENLFFFRWRLKRKPAEHQSRPCTWQPLRLLPDKRNDTLPGPHGRWGCRRQHLRTPSSPVVTSESTCCCTCQQRPPPKSQCLFDAFPTRTPLKPYKKPHGTNCFSTRRKTTFLVC